jgi:acetoin utilization deacetylase AcuC-like enzyme
MPSAQSRFKIRPLLGLLLLVLLLPDVLLVEALAAIPIFFDSSNTLHRDIQYHPETPERITVCVQALDTYQKQQAEATIQLSDVAPDVAENSTIRKEHRPFSELELSHARDILLQTHQPALVTRLEERCRSSRQKRMEDGKAALGYIGRIDEDTYITTETFDVCLRATAAWIRSVDIALDSTTGSSSSLALTRPPGHHATYALQNVRW